MLTDPSAITRAVRDELGRATQDAAAKANEPHFLPETFFRSEEEIAADLAARRVVVLHGAAVAGEGEGLAAYEVTREAAPSRRLRPRGPHARREGRALDQGQHRHARARSRAASGTSGTTASACSSPRARRRRPSASPALLRHQDVRCRIRGAAFDPAWLYERTERAGHGEDEDDAQIIVGPLGRGVILPARASSSSPRRRSSAAARIAPRERKTRRDNARPFLEDLRALSVGDYVVHVEHGIGRYLGLVHRDVGGAHASTCSSSSTPAATSSTCPSTASTRSRSSRAARAASRRSIASAAQTFAKTKARVEKAVTQMADELLRLYAERQAQPGDAARARRRRLPRVRGDVPVRRDAPIRPRAIDDVIGDLETPRPMDRLVCGDVGFGKTEVAIRAAFRVGDGRQAGRRALPDDGARAAALPHLRGAHAPTTRSTVRALSRFQTQEGAGRDARAASRTARSTSSSARTACSRRTSTSRTSACSSSTRSSASA